MKISSNFSLLFSVTVWWWLDSVANAQTPSDYFGGLNHDAYLSWSNTSSYSYVTSVFLESSANATKGVAVHWTLNATHIRLAVAARATGWVGFGIAESGGMRGADIVLFEAETKTLTDTHVLDDLVMPITDICQNWELVGSQTEGGFIIFEATRLLDTGDTQDRPIINDSTLDVVAQNVIPLGVMIPLSRIMALVAESVMLFDFTVTAHLMSSRCLSVRSDSKPKGRFPFKR